MIAKERRVGQCGDRGSGDDVRQVVLLRVQGRDRDEDRPDDRRDPDAAVQPVAGERGEERVGDVEGRKAVVRGVAAVDERQAPRKEPVPDRSGRPGSDRREDEEPQVRDDDGGEVGHDGPAAQPRVAHDEHREEREHVQRHVHRQPLGTQRQRTVERNLRNEELAPAHQRADEVIERDERDQRESRPRERERSCDRPSDPVGSETVKAVEAQRPASAVTSTSLRVVPRIRAPRAPPFASDSASRRALLIQRNAPVRAGERLRVHVAVEPPAEFRATMTS